MIRFQENRTSQILAYFLNPDSPHGQKTKFLQKFLELVQLEFKDLSNVQVCCEKLIKNNRRIDIHIQIGKFQIGIENKLWAVDQNNQLRDYAEHLNCCSKDNYLLLYLTPDGKEPGAHSIDLITRQTLQTNNRFKKLNYEEQIIQLVDEWIAVCKADNVRYYLVQFRQHIEQKFSNTKKSIMTDSMKKLIYDNKNEVETLLGTYFELQNEVLKKLQLIQDRLNSHEVSEADVIIFKQNIFTHMENVKIYKWSISQGGNLVWIQVIQEGIELYINYYYHAGEVSTNLADEIDQSVLSRQKDYLLASATAGEISDKFLENVYVAISIMRNSNKSSC